MENPANAVERKMFEDSLYVRLPVLIQIITEPFKGRERDIVLLSSLGVASSCIPNVYGIYDGDRVYPHLFVIIIAPPASGKGVMNNSRRLIDKIHKTTIEISKLTKKECENKKKENKDKKQDFEPCPELEIKILPGNISTSEMYSFLGTSQHGLIIIESEADTISNMFKNEWGNYSEVLRKVFHHEPVSISRKMENIFIEIQEPKLAMVISGTPDQLQPLNMMKLKWSNIQDGRIYYTRSKTKGQFNIEILENVQEILDYYKAQNRPTGYVFPILLKEDLTPQQIENRKHKVLSRYNKKLKEIAQIAGVEKGITSYFFRHSFATIQKQIGTETNVISELMGHSDVQITMTYLKEFDKEVLDKANRKLLNI